MRHFDAVAWTREILRHPRSTRADPFAAFEEKVDAWLKRTPTLSDQEIFEFLLQEGYPGSERTVNRRMKRARDALPKERFFEQNYTPGEQAQFDFKECVELPFIDRNRVVHLHFGTSYGGAGKQGHQQDWS